MSWPSPVPSRAFDQVSPSNSELAASLNRIVIFGRPGSGKSTLAKLLARSIGVPLYHLDVYYYSRNWTPRPRAEFIATAQEIIGQDRWIIDGNCLGVLEARYARADIALYLNRSRPLCYWRVWKRRLFARGPASDRPRDCPYGLPWKLLLYIWSYERRIRARLLDLQTKYPHVTLVEVASNAEEQAALCHLIATANRVRTAKPSSAWCDNA